MRAYYTDARRGARLLLLVLVALVQMSRSGRTLAAGASARFPVIRLRGGMGKRNLDAADEIHEDGQRASEEVLRSRRLFKSKSRRSDSDVPKGQLFGAAPGHRSFVSEPRSGAGDAGDSAPASSFLGLFENPPGPSSAKGGTSPFGGQAPAGGADPFGGREAIGGAAQGGSLTNPFAPNTAALGASGSSAQSIAPAAAPAAPAVPLRGPGAAAGNAELSRAAELMMREYTAPLRELEGKLSAFITDHLRSVRDLQARLPPRPPPTPPAPHHPRPCPRAAPTLPPAPRPRTRPRVRPPPRRRRLRKGSKRWRASRPKPPRRCRTRSRPAPARETAPSFTARAPRG